MASGGIKNLLSGVFGKNKAEEAPAPVPERENQQSSYEETLIRLQQMVEERNFVDVRFPTKSDTAYQSLLLKVDPIEQVVVIDELFPAHGAYLISPGDEVEVTSTRKGLPVRFSTWIKAISISDDDGIPAYKLAMPNTVDAKQRRKNFRVSIDPDSGIKLRIRGPDQNRLLCTVQNLSYGGIGFTCHGNLTEQLRETPIMRNSILSIQGIGDITLDIEARSFEFRRQPYRHTAIGARMDNISAGDMKKVEQYLLLVQRQRRKDENRGAS